MERFSSQQTVKRVNLASLGIFVCMLIFTQSYASTVTTCPVPNTILSSQQGNDCVYASSAAPGDWKYTASNQACHQASQFYSGFITSSSDGNYVTCLYLSDHNTVDISLVSQNHPGYKPDWLASCDKADWGGWYWSNITYSFDYNVACAKR